MRVPSTFFLLYDTINILSANYFNCHLIDIIYWEIFKRSIMNKKYEEMLEGKTHMWPKHHFLWMYRSAGSSKYVFHNSANYSKVADCRLVTLLSFNFFTYAIFKDNDWNQTWKKRVVSVTPLSAYFYCMAILCSQNKLVQVKMVLNDSILLYCRVIQVLQELNSNKTY